jgi:hypothetical protein
MNKIIRNEHSNIETVEIQDHATGAWITPAGERDAHLRQEVAERMATLQTSLEKARKEGFAVALPELRRPTNLIETIALLATWQRVVDAALEDGRLAKGWRTHLYRLLTELDDMCRECPEDVEGYAGEIEEFLADPRTPSLVAPSFLKWCGRCVAYWREVARNELVQRRHKTQPVYWSEADEVAYRQEVRDQARRDAEAVMNARVPSVTNLRLGKRGRERYERLDFKVTRPISRQGGIPKIRHQHGYKRSSSRCYQEYLRFERSLSLDLRSKWRREQRKLAGE